MNKNPSLRQRLDDLIKNPYLVDMYAKHNCKQCRGRGFITYVGFDQGKTSTKALCQCIIKKIKREIASDL